MGGDDPQRELRTEGAASANPTFQVLRPRAKIATLQSQCFKCSNTGCSFEMQKQSNNLTPKIAQGKERKTFLTTMIYSHGGFELVVDRLVSCCRLLLICSVNSTIIVPLDVGYCLLHLIYLSLCDCISLI